MRGQALQGRGILAFFTACQQRPVPDLQKRGSAGSSLLEPVTWSMYSTRLGEGGDSASASAAALSGACSRAFRTAAASGARVGSCSARRTAPRRDSGRAALWARAARVSGRFGCPPETRYINRPLVFQAPHASCIEMLMCKDAHEECKDLDCMVTSAVCFSLLGSRSKRSLPTGTQQAGPSSWQQRSWVQSHALGDRSTCRHRCTHLGSQILTEGLRGVLGCRVPCPAGGPQRYLHADEQVWFRYRHPQKLLLAI